MNNNQDIFNNNPQMKILNNLNNQDNLNNNPQMNILNNQNQKLIAGNSNEPLNVIPNSKPIGHNQNDNHQFDVDFIKTNQNGNNDNINIDNNQVQNQNTFINNPINNLNNNLMNNITTGTTNDFEEENPMLNLNKNKFITTNEEVKDTSLNSMNVNGEYNNMPKVDYSQEPKVRENIEMINKNGAKNTIKIGNEGKVFLIIIAILLIFTFVMPTIYDAIRNAR